MSLLNRLASASRLSQLQAPGVYAQLRASPMVLLATFVAVALMHGATLLRYPAPFVDEAWYVSRAWGFIQTNRVFGALDVGIFDFYEGYWTYLPFVPTFIQSLALRLFSVPALLPLRAVSLLFGLILLGAIYHTGRAIGGRRLGLVAMLLLAFSNAFFKSAHLARTDVLAAAFGYVAVALCISNRAERLWKSFLAGLLIGLACEIHLHAAIFAPAVAAIYLVRFRWSVLRNRSSWALGAGLGVGLAIYIALHILPYPQTYFATTQMAFSTTHTPPILTLDPSVMAQAIREMWRFSSLTDLLLAPLWVGALIMLWRRRATADQELLVLGLALFIGHAMLIRQKLSFYALLTLPALDLMVAAFLLQVVRRDWNNRVSGIIARAAVLSYLILNLSFLRVNGWQHYQEVQERIRHSVLPGDSIMGPQTYWLNLYEHPYMAWEALPYYQHANPGSTLEEALSRYGPDIFIIDAHSDYYITDEPNKENLYLQAFLQVPEAELMRFLHRRATLLDTFDDDLYGKVRLYRIDWNNAIPAAR